jgi:hypothetical protein
MMDIIMPETCWAVSERQKNKILRLIVASSWVFYLSVWRCTERQTLKKLIHPKNKNRSNLCKRCFLCNYIKNQKKTKTTLDLKLLFQSLFFIFTLKLKLDIHSCALKVLCILTSMKASLLKISHRHNKL